MFRDEQLTERARKGDHRATEELVRRYQPKAYEVAYRICEGDPEEAKDCTQEAFLRAFRKIGSFKGDSSFYTWFYRIVVNTCLDGIRHRRRRDRILSFRQAWQKGGRDAFEEMQEQTHSVTNENPLKILSGKRLDQETRKALTALPEKQRLVFQLKVFDGMKIREIAQVLGSAEGTVKSHLFRATRFLREALKDWVEP